MRIFEGIKEAFKEVERDLNEMGSIVQVQSMQDKNVSGNDDYTTKELQGYSYKITNRAKLREEFVELGGNIKYAEKEFHDRINPAYLNPGNSWEERPDVWREFIHDNKFSYTYNERIREQLPIIHRELNSRPDSRQAIITMYDRHQDIANLGGKSRIPCSMYYQFLIRKRRDVKRVDVIYTMRSCDIYTHFIYDIYITMELQRFIANSLGYDPGHFTHFIGSLHAYKKDYKDKGVF